MKELSIEEKAIAYDEVVGKLKRFMAQGVDPLITRADVQDFFPEIKDNENERIRKEIIAFLTYYHTGQGNSVKYDDSWLDWLENQGEDKEMNNFDVIPGLYKCVHRMFDGTPDGRLLFEVGNIYKCLSKHDRAEFEVSYGHSVYLEDPVVCKHFIPYIEKQGNQKLIDKVEPTPIFRVGDTLKRKGKDYTFVVDRIQGGYYHCDHSNGAFFPIEEQDNWELVEQHQSWSEEDEHNKRQICRILKDNGCSTKLQEKIEKWIEDRLKSLKDRVQTTSKYTLPQREEGEPLIYYFEGCIAEISPLLRELFFEVVKEIKTKQWKPSDEQLDALEHFVRSIGESGYASPYDNNTKLLYSLLEQLKKLREE